VPSVLLFFAFETRADDTPALERALEFAREFMFAHHFRADVHVDAPDPNGHGSPRDHFTYERYPQVERIKSSDIIYTKKPGLEWVQSEDSVDSAKPVDPATASRLDDDLAMAQVAWLTRHSSHDTTQGAVIIKLVEHTKDKVGEHFVFERTREHPTARYYPRYFFTDYSHSGGQQTVLDKFNGPVVLRDQKLFLTVNYTYFIDLKNAHMTILKPATPDH
jgi:hypothetical protein